MTLETTIQQVDSTTFDSQKYLYQDENIIPSFNFDTTFLSESDCVEISMYDENKNQINNYVELDNNHYPVLNGDILLNPEKDLAQLGLNQGSYYVNYNFFRKRVSSDSNTLFYISEISSDRTEIRLSSNQISNISIINSTNDFINYRDDATYLVDFYLNFGNNKLIISNNIKLDTTQDNPTILIKLYEPLPIIYNVKDTLWVVESISDPQTYLITFPASYLDIIDYEYIKGPNFNLNVKDQTSSTSQKLSYNEIFKGNISGSNQQISNILNQKGIDINLNYNDFSNFIHFSSAKARLENFYYKNSLIELYQEEISTFLGSITGSTTSSIEYNINYTSLTGSIDNIINDFDRYEHFLYFDSGSLYSWPKQNDQPPYALHSTGSSQVNIWFENMQESASLYDQNNQDWLYWTIPEYLRNDSENKNYEIFLDMIGQHFDSIWVYIERITNKFNADNRLNYGISKTLVADAIKDFGVKLYSNNFNINDLYTSFLGITPSGSLFPFPDITETLPALTGYEFIDTKISSSNTDIIPLDDLNKSIYKRIYHNLLYLLKTKGTITGLRALINIYGIPNTILKVNEFGGKDRNNSEDWDFQQNVFNYAFDTQNGTQYLRTSDIISNDNFGGGPPNTIQFRFKTNGIPTNLSQSLFNISDISGSSVSTIIIEYSGSNIISGSYSGSISNLESNYGTIKYIPDTTTANISASIYLPIFDGDWWNLQATFDDNLLTASLSIANEIDGKIGFISSNLISGSFPEYFSSSLAHSYLSIPSGSTKTIDSKVYSAFEGQFQELRYYNTILNSSSFYNYILNPYSCEGNSINSTPNELYFRASLGSTLDLDNRESIHPKVTGSWVTTASFNSTDSSFTLSSGSFTENREIIYYNQPVVGIKNAITDKINIEDVILPEGDTLSPFRSIQQNSFISSSYSPDVNYLEVAFSPSDQINEDIMSQIGYLNIGDYIGDPRHINDDGNTYPDLDKLRNDFFQKYEHNYNVNDFIRLIKYFDNSLFKMLKDFVPAKTDLATGIIIKQHLLERNKQKPVQLSYEDVTYTSSIKNLPNNYIEEEKLYTTEGGTGGSFSHLEGESNLNAITQSWNQNPLFPYQMTSSANNTLIRNDQREYFNGELPGSSVYTQLEKHCQQYKTGDTASFSHDFDCQPNFNNVEEARQNPNLQDIDYSVGIDVPINLDQLVSGSATKGTVPESNYTLKRHKLPRYDGSKVSSDGVNLNTGLIGAYDKYPPVESKKTHFAYISEIKDPYPVVNNTTNLFVKYVIDTETNIDDPKLSDITFYNMKNVFIPNEVINSSLIVPKQEQQFIKLNGQQNISHIGEVAVPILYSQTASDGWANLIPLSASNQNSSVQNIINYGETAYESNMSNLFTPNTGSFYIDAVRVTSSIIFLDPDYVNPINDSISDLGIVSGSNLNSDYSISWKILIPSTVPQSLVPVFPSVTLNSLVANISKIDGNYTIFSFGNGTPINDGICWSTSGAPTLSDSVAYNTVPDPTSGTYTVTTPDLATNPAITYHVRAFANTEVGTYYSNELTINF